MILDLLDWNLLRFITVRAALAAVTAFVLGLALGPRLIAFLKAHKIGEETDKGDSATLDEIHRLKRGTPTMGGLLIVGATVAATLLFARLDSFFVEVGLFAMVALGALGALDDWTKLTTKGRGTSARAKFQVQWAIGLCVGLAIYLHYQGVVFADAVPQMGEDEQSVAALPPERIVEGTALYVPFAERLSLGLGLGYALFAALVIVATCNAVNLTDGMDGLAAGSASFVILTFVAIAYVTGRVDWSSHLHLPYVPGAGEAAVLGAAALGATLAFLWFNAHPAEMFMGDTGSLALGGLIAVLALAVKQELLLPLAGGVFVLEAGSVVLQVSSYKLRGGKRIFRCAPIHHHFQFGGLKETKVTTRFWILGAILAVLALASLKVR